MLSRAIKKLELLFGLDCVRWNNLPNGIYSINFHRIGDWKKTRFDPCVFSCNAKQLEQYLNFFKQYFDIVSIAEAVDLVNSRTANIHGKYLVITFDDGYQDNYTEAFPLLKKYKVPACFFIATSLIGNKKLPWWDRIAYNYKINNFKSIQLTHWKKALIFNGDDREYIRRILTAAKSSDVPIEEQLNEIEQLFPIAGEIPCQQFLSWENLAEMTAAGMDVGAHSHNHEILAHLTQQQVIYELTHSKQLIEQNLPYKVQSFSYPVGSLGTYNDEVMQALVDCGYDIAFNFQPGVNVSLEKNKYDLRRFSIEPSSTIASLKKQISYAQLF